MLRTTWKKRIAAGALCLAMASGAVMPTVAGAAGADNSAKPTQEGYVSLHQYISPTDQEDVYQVTLSIKGDPGQIPETEIAILIDSSTSMNEVGDSNTFLDTYPDKIMWDALFWTVLLAPLPFYTREAMDKYHMSQGNPALMGKSILNGFSSHPTDHTSLAGWVTPLTAGHDTRIRAALTGAQEAVDIFLNPAINAGAKVTSAGIVVFNDVGDTSLEPYATLNQAVVGFTFGYGYMEESKQERDSIVFSSRMFHEDNVLAAGVGLGYNWAAQLGGDPFAKSVLNQPLPKLIDTVLADTTNQTYTKENQQSASRGMIFYDEKGENKTLLQNALKEVKASTADSGTELAHGLAEAAIMLGVDLIDTGAPSVKLGTPPSATDGKRRFVILLSDGEDSGWLPATFEKVSEMKNAGVQFYTMGIQTTGEAVQKTNHTGTGYRKDGSAWPGAIYIDVTNSSLPANWKNWEGTKNVSASEMLKDASPALNSEFEQPLVFMATDYHVDQHPFSTTYATWEDVEADYLGGPSNGKPDWNRADPKYYYVGKTNNITAEIKDTFAEIAKRIIQFGENAQTQIKLNSNFTLYQYPGKPLFEKGGIENQTVINKGGSINWNFNGDGIPTMKEATLTFYVKLNSKAVKAGEFQSPLEKLVFSATGPFPGEGAKPRYGWPERDVTIAFPQAYITAAGGITSEDGSGTEVEGEKQAEVKPDLEFEDSPTISAALPIAGGLGSYAAREDAQITGVESKKLKTGKTQVQVAVKNGSEMYYQWQYQDESKNWVDIFGANGSTHTLGKKFKSGKKYQLRCVVSNAAGKKFESDTLEVTATKADIVGETLQSTSK